jgi:uncharacterized protein YggE
MWRSLSCLAFAAAWASSAAAQTSTPFSDTPVVVTSGEAVVRVAPDLAYLTLGTETRARNPRDAQRQNADIMTAVQLKLRDARVPSDAIRTVGYQVEEESDYVEGRRVPRGYVVRNAIEVRVDDVKRLGELVDVAVGAGATTVRDIRYDVKDRAAVERRALRDAAADARGRAEAAAEGAGRAIDRVLRVEEHRAITGPRPVAPVVMAARAAAPETPITAGEIEIHALVTLTAALK